MDIKILHPVSAPYADEFVVTATAEFGDADGEKEIVIACFPNTPLGKLDLESCVDFCNRIKASYPGGRNGHSDHYRGVVEGYEKWLGKVWVGDPMTDYEVEATFGDYEVAYYDKNSMKYAVEIS